MEYVTLNNGIKMPKLGYGVYQLSNEECERCVLDAISAGYRSIDTAQSYGNEEAVGNAINKCGVPREELFITTKVWITNGGYEKAKESLEESLRKLHQNRGFPVSRLRAGQRKAQSGDMRVCAILMWRH